MIRSILLGTALCLAAAALETLGILAYLKGTSGIEGKYMTGLFTSFPLYVALGVGLGLGCGLFWILVSRSSWFRRQESTHGRALERGLLVSLIIFIYLGVVVHSRLFGNTTILHPLSLLLSAGLILLSFSLAFSLELFVALLGRKRRLKVAVTSALTVALLLSLAWGGLFYRQHRWSPRNVVDETFARAKLVGDASVRRPNILLITVDTLRADHLSAYGYKRIRTENIDRLANEGVLFEQMIAQSSWTKPSFGSMWTSLYPSQHQANARKLSAGKDRTVPSFSRGLREDVATLAQILSSGGYMTVGLNTNPQLMANNGFNRGFQWYVDDVGRRGKNHKNLFRYSILWPLIYKLNLSAALLSRSRGVPYPTAQKVLSNIDQMLRRWPLEARPYFFWVHFMDPHLPYLSHEAGLTKRSPREFGGMIKIRKLLNELENISELKEEMNAAYDREILYVDHHIGKLLARLRKSGLLANTAVIFTSDHGEELLDRWNKSSASARRFSFYRRGYDHGHTMYDELLRVPLIVRFPDKRYAGKKVKSIVQHIDLLPTLVAYAGIKPKGNTGRFEGVSLLKHLSGEKSLPFRYARSESTLYGPEVKQIRSKNYKLIYRMNRKITEFYHLASDPLERKNIAGKRGELYGEMLSALNSWIVRMRLENPPRKIFAAGREELIPENLDQQAREELMEQLKALGYIQ